MKAAYEVLNDAERRKRYDHIGDEEEPYVLLVDFYVILTYGLMYGDFVKSCV